MDMVGQAKQHGINAQQNEHESTMCWIDGNTHFYTCSCGHGGLEIAKMWVIAIMVHIPHVVVVALGCVIRPG
jgi:prephenate dehydrogenase